MKGKVYLVGAGPGDPELLTVKAVRLLQSAEAVLYDDLVAPEILSLIPRTAQLHNVGKRCGTKKIKQEEINFLMIALADSGLQRCSPEVRRPADLRARRRRNRLPPQSRNRVRNCSGSYIGIRRSCRDQYSADSSSHFLRGGASDGASGRRR